MHVLGGRARIEKWKRNEKKFKNELKTRMKRMKKKQGYDQQLINIIGNSYFEKYSVCGDMESRRIEKLSSLKAKPQPCRVPSKWNWACTLCHFNAKSPRNAKNHVKTHQTQMKKAKTIGKVVNIVTKFKIGNILKTGRITETKRYQIDGTVYTCEFCPFSSKVRHDLWSHSSFHEKIGNFGICSECSFSASSIFTMQQHLIWHSLAFVLSKNDESPISVDQEVWYYTDNERYVAPPIASTRIRNKTSVFQSPLTTDVKVRASRKRNVEHPTQDVCLRRRKLPPTLKTQEVEEENYEDDIEPMSVGSLELMLNENLAKTNFTPALHDPIDETSAEDLSYNSSARFLNMKVKKEKEVEESHKNFSINVKTEPVDDFGETPIQVSEPPPNSHNDIAEDAGYSVGYFGDPHEHCSMPNTLEPMFCCNSAQILNEIFASNPELRNIYLPQTRTFKREQ